MKEEARLRRCPVFHSSAVPQRQFGSEQAVSHWRGLDGLTSAEALPQVRVRIDCHLGPEPRLLWRRYMTKTTKSRRKHPVRKGGPLTAIRPSVAGIDVGSREHWVCGPAQDDELNVRPFGTTTAELEALADWLVAQHVESVVMESTSVYWIPLYEVLEARGIEPVLVDARQLHNVPGRKTDVRDCQWLQTLHSHGLLRGSFRPSDDIVRLRSLQRQQANFVEQRTRCVQWMQKALDQMNVQVHHAVTNLVGDTGLAIVRAIVAGERDPVRLAAHRHYACRKSSRCITHRARLVGLCDRIDVFYRVSRVPRQFLVGCRHQTSNAPVE